MLSSTASRSYSSTGMDDLTDIQWECLWFDHLFDWNRLLEEAGYCTLETPAPEDLVAAIARCDSPVVGVVVTRREAPAYVAAATASGDPDLVRGIDYLEELDAHIAEFDEVL